MDEKDKKIGLLERQLARVKRSQKEAESILEQQSKQLFRTNEKLRMAYQQQEQVIEERTRDLKIATEAAQQANLSKSQFLANMSHELRTPMHAILSFATLALKRSDDEKLTRFLGNIRTSGIRLTGLLNNLLDLSKLEAGKMIAEFLEQDLTTLIDQSIVELHSLIDDKDIKVTVKPYDTFDCMVDQKLIVQVIINLLSNAIKFSPKQCEIKVDIAKSTQLFNDVLQEIITVKITDHGVGIPENEVDTIFDKFIQSSKTDNKSGGTGLGLPIAKEIIELHSGRIWAQSPPDGLSHGSTFVFQLPVLQGLKSPEPFSHLDKAVVSHSEWINALDDVFAGKRIPIEYSVEIVTNENLCEFGQWLNSTPIKSTYMHDLQKVHKAFHINAGEYLAFYEMGEIDKANELRAKWHKNADEIQQLIEKMGLIVWSDEYSVGVHALDQQHKKIVTLINNLAFEMINDVPSDSVDEILNQMIKYAMQHLEYEEKLLSENNYPEYEGHKTLHTRYFEQFNQVASEAKLGGRQAKMNFLHFLQGWWQNHILIEDMKYKPFFAQKGIA